VNTSFSVRNLLGPFVAMVLAFAFLSGGTSPAQGDSNEGSPVTIPSYKTKAGKITAGDGHTCAVIGANSTVWCWGHNDAGQLGNGTTVDSSTAVQVSGLSGVTQISAGGNHTCALLSSGAARCWGGNGNGQLGNGTTQSSSVPVTPAGGHTFTSISASRVFTCGTTATQVRCWGLNASGQLGTGDFNQRNFPAVAGVPGTPRIVSTGRNQACAVNSTKTLYCWGANSSGQLGLGVSGAPQAAPQQVTTLTGIEAVSMGTHHACALSSAASGGGTYCWGLQSQGRLGNGNTSSTIQSTPVHPSDPNPNGDRVISTGIDHTCVTNAFFLRCWGGNSEGQLGNGTTTDSAVPFRVPGYDTEVPIITTGADHTCVQYTLGQVDCWGENQFGELGNGTTTGSATGVHAIRVPRPPVTIDVKPGGTERSLEVSWTPGDRGGLPTKNYRVRDLNGAFDVLVPGNATSHTITGLSLGQPYRFYVSAINELGEGQGLERVPFTLTSETYVEVNDVSHVEGHSGLKTMSFTVTRLGKTSTAGSVKVTTQNGGGFDSAPATAPSDFTAKTATVSFAAGQSTKTFNVTTKGDKLTEDDETFLVVLSSPVGAQIWRTSGRGTIVNDDPGEKPAYSISNANIVEGNSGTTNMVFTITRTGSTAVAGSVKYFTVGLAGHATAGEDFTNKSPTGVSFPIGVTSKNVTVAIKGDLVAESDEYFQVGLSHAVNGDLPAFPYGYGQILNDDSNDPPTIAIADATFLEGDGFSKSVTFTITRSGNLAGTTAFKYQTQNGSAVAPTDYVAKALTNLSFSPGQTTKTVSISVKGGSVVEPDEEFYVVLSAMSGGSISDGSATGTILNDD